MNRTPIDGKPYYCIKCGLGYGEYMACEEPDCELEPHDFAIRRATDAEEAQNLPNKIERDYP